MSRVLVLLAMTFAIACTANEDSPSKTQETSTLPWDYSYVADLPDYYLNASSSPTGDVGAPGFEAAIDSDNTPAHNPVTDAGATLGRVLFYDNDLSQNREISCASCHVAEFGFADDRALSEGFEGGQTGRHSMGLANARFYANGRFFWDQRAETLEDQVLMPLQDAVEMGMTLDEVVARVEEDDRYPLLFESAFGDDQVDSERISRALAQFVRSIVSTTSPYDVGRPQVADIIKAFPNFTDVENEGKMLFYASPEQGGLGCGQCHGTDAQIGNAAISNGLDAAVVDEGYGSVTLLPDDMATFKVPSLRNIGVRAPYMHDGRFATLSDVIDHYSEGVQDHPSLPDLFRDGSGEVAQLQMTDLEKASLLAFLHTLTDEALLADPKFSDPGW